MSDSSHWFAIHTNPRQEDRADQNLRAWNVKTFSPKIRERRFNPFTGDPTYLIAPLFPRYIFAHFNVSDAYHKIRFTRGVESLVGAGGNPAPVDQSIIDAIKSRITLDGFVTLNEVLNPGDPVLIHSGPLSNFTGVFEREMKGPDRVRILLETVNYTAHVIVDREMVKRATV